MSISNLSKNLSEIRYFIFYINIIQRCPRFIFIYVIRYHIARFSILSRRSVSREKRCGTVLPEKEPWDSQRITAGASVSIWRRRWLLRLRSTTTTRTVSAYRERLRSLKERTKWCKSSSVARMHARCNALATDLEIVSSTPTRWRRSRLFISRALLRAR